MQSRIRDSRAQPNGCRLRRVRMGWRKREPASNLSHSRMRFRPGCPPVRTVASSPMASDPAGYRVVRILAPLALALALSASIEMLQLFDDSRQCSLADVASNAMGAAVGIAAGAGYRVKLQRLLARRGTASPLRPSGALLLLACWLGYQLFPLFPVWGRTNLVNRLAAL